jgi:hypothetical protein
VPAKAAAPARNLRLSLRFIVSSVIGCRRR